MGARRGTRSFIEAANTRWISSRSRRLRSSCPITSLSRRCERLCRLRGQGRLATERFSSPASKRRFASATTNAGRVHCSQEDRRISWWSIWIVDRGFDLSRNPIFLSGESNGLPEVVTVTLVGGVLDQQREKTK